MLQKHGGKTVARCKPNERGSFYVLNADIRASYSKSFSLDKNVFSRVKSTE